MNVVCTIIACTVHSNMRMPSMKMGMGLCMCMEWLQEHIDNVGIGLANSIK